MKARIHFSAPDASGNFETSLPGRDFRAWCREVGEATTSSQGFGYFVGDVFSIPLRYITRIEKLED